MLSGGSFPRGFLFGLAVVLGILNGVVCASLRDARSERIESTRDLSATFADGSLSCDEIYRIGQWSGTHYGGARKNDFRSQAFVDRALELFVEKMDPYRLLFTAGEVREFQKRGAEAWSRLVNARHCGYFDQWARANYPQAKARFLLRLKSLPLETYFPRTLKADAGDDTPEPRYKKFRGFAKDEAGLKKRLTSLVRVMAQGATKRVMEAYGNDRRRYLVDSIDQLLFETAPTARGLLAKSWLSALDPYSTYFSPAEFDDFYSDLSGGTSGVGVRVRRVPRGLLVEKVLKDSAAFGKLQEGDVITAVDGLVVSTLPAKASKRLLSGPEASRVALKIDRPGASSAIELKLARKRFAFEESRIKHRFVPAPGQAGARVCVVEIPSFYGRGGMNPIVNERSSADDLRRVVSEVVKSKEPIAAMVLDLRGNPGGYLEEAVSMAGLFIGDKPVVGVVESKSRRVLRDLRRKPVYTGPLVMLIDEGSASAAEILAGALRDHQRAVLVGSDHTYGKGSVQKLFHLDDDLLTAAYGEKLGTGVVKLTTSIFYSPLGHSPANGGIKAHITLPLMASGNDSVAEGTHAGNVPEEKPFVEDDMLGDIRLRASQLDASLDVLKRRSEQRLRGHATKVAELSDDSMNPDANVDPVTEKEQLDEAVAIASDFAGLRVTDTAQRDSAKTKTSSQSQPAIIRVPRRPVIM